MRFEHGWIHIDTDDAPLPAYASRAAAARGPLPGILVIQEAWGVDAHIQDLCDRLAAAGYQTLAPDLYARGGGRPAPLAAPRIDQARRLVDRLPAARLPELIQPAGRGAILAEEPEEDRARLEETVASLFPIPPLDSFLDLLAAGLRHLRGGPSQGCRVGALGFCMGGGLAPLLATADPELAGAVMFYGPGPTADRLPAITCPILGLYGQNDPRIMNNLPVFTDAMRAAGKRFEPVVYPQAAHAFMNDTRPAYDVAAARDAWARTLAFFAREL